MKKFCKTRFIYAIALGYYKANYSGEFGHTGYMHSILLPFCLIQWGIVIPNKNKILNEN